MLLKPKPFDISNPEYSTNGRVCVIAIHIDSQYFNFIERLPYVSSTTKFPDGWNLIHVWLNNRYGAEDVWLDLYEQLTIETSKVELSSAWDVELNDVPPSEE